MSLPAAQTHPLPHRVATSQVSQLDPTPPGRPPPSHVRSPIPFFLISASPRPERAASSHRVPLFRFMPSYPRPSTSTLPRPSTALFVHPRPPECTTRHQISSRHYPQLPFMVRSTRAQLFPDLWPQPHSSSFSGALGPRHSRRGPPSPLAIVKCRHRSHLHPLAMDSHLETFLTSSSSTPSHSNDS
jgi:hypothetical protein